MLTTEYPVGYFSLLKVRPEEPKDICRYNFVCQWNRLELLKRSFRRMTQLDVGMSKTSRRGRRLIVSVTMREPGLYLIV